MVVNRVDEIGCDCSIATSSHNSVVQSGFEPVLPASLRTGFHVNESCYSNRRQAAFHCREAPDGSLLRQRPSWIPALLPDVLVHTLREHLFVVLSERWRR